MRGIKTTEFYLCASVVIVSLVAAVGFLPIEKVERAVALATSLLTALGYAAIRTQAKTKIENKDGKQVPSKE